MVAATVVVTGTVVTTGAVAATTVEVVANAVDVVAEAIVEVVANAVDVVAEAIVEGGRVSNVGPAFVDVHPARAPTLSADVTTTRRNARPRRGIVRTGTMDKGRSFRRSLTVLPPVPWGRRARPFPDRTFTLPLPPPYASTCLHVREQ